jgi:hypothetical protein
MRKAKDIASLGILVVVALVLSLISPVSVKPVSADPSILAWSVIDTPSQLNNIVVTPSEVNDMAIGPDNYTIYALDIPSQNSSGSLGRLYKSGDGGITWQNELSAQLIADGAFMPVWYIAVAPDDSNFVVAVTDLTGGLSPGGPKGVFISRNGGAKWENTKLLLGAAEFISCVDISVTYGSNSRDVAIGTRDGGGTGKVWILRAAEMAPSWGDQGLPPSDVVAVKFSPTYPNDLSLLVLSSDFVNTKLHLGSHDTAFNTTTWNPPGYPVVLWDSGFPGTSPTVLQIITADLALPIDFSGTTSSLRRCYVSTDATDNQSGVYRVDDTVPHRINPPTSGRISSIAYSGTYAEGKLLAGEVTADPALGQVNVWRTSDPTANPPTWVKSDSNKSPTGGGNSGDANAQVAWSPDGATAYCGTSSACLGAFSTPNGSVICTIPPGPGPEWPDGYLNGVALDESAFSISPYTPAYRQLLTSFNKTADNNVGNIWNQVSLIDTEIDRLTDVAALQAPLAGEMTTDYDILYLCSKSDNMTIPVRFNSVWRSTGYPLGTTWERVLCFASDNVSILRVKQSSYEDTERSNVIVFAALNGDIVGYSANEGQLWDVRPFTLVTDLVLSGDDTIYILNNAVVYQYKREGTGWVLRNKVNTDLDFGHTIVVPLKNPANSEGTLGDWVLVGEAGLPFGTGRIFYADFSETIVKGGPPIDERIPPPVVGDAHVIFDDKFEQNRIIYNAVRDTAGGNGKIYRWTIGKSTAWDELLPPNAEFYGLAQRNDVLYGAWKTPQAPAVLNSAGVDRTLYPRRVVPPSPEWDYLITGLPITVRFDGEPSSLKISSNDYNNLWAIDNQPYDFANRVGCLWAYTDIIAKVGPWTTAPPSGSSIPVDPRSGRAVEVNFSWRQLSYCKGYELQLAKDADFYNRVLVSENITPVDELAPAVYLPAGALIPASGSNIGGWGNLESGHTYYWRVRATLASTGEIIRSPWSATMYFTVEAGLPTTSAYPSVTLFSPIYGSRNVPVSPSFSWSGMPGTTKYEFILAKDAALQQVIVKVQVPTTSYLYDGKLDYNTIYFWQVRAIEPVVSDPSPIGTFTVVAESEPTTPAVEQPKTIPVWVWWIIAVLTALIASIIAFAMVKPSYSRPSGGGKLFKVEPVVDKPIEPILDKPKNPVSKIWESIIMAVRRLRFLRRPGDVKSDIKSTESQSSDSQEKLP